MRTGTTFVFRRLLSCFWVAVTVLIGVVPVSAHVFAPALLELRETDADRFAVRWKQPNVQPAGARAGPRLPGTCRVVGDTQIRREGTGSTALWTVHCPGGLEGRELSVDGIASTRANVLLRLERVGGGSIRHVLTADAPVFVVPSAESFSGVIWSYSRLGIEHIASGIDHLLFVLGLVLLVGGGRRLLWTVTAFTLGHSVTLALATLGLVRVPQAPVEVLIAFSIYLLAVDLARGPRSSHGEVLTGRTWMQRHPGWMAGSFGLFHGLGFAGALTEAGLPSGDIPTALFAFNAGIELGQLAFVALVLAAGAAFRALVRPGASIADGRIGWRTRVPTVARAIPVYVIGCLAAYWMIERGADLLL
ncbi:MAG: HupE/UreJ family protein [Deltaproteobacteria bacterium]|nr:HupE/UreJ family protein [Deltaproteobacteria bacterium]